MNRGGVVDIVRLVIYWSLGFGARLILSYDAVNNQFIGTVENTTNAALTRVRVEIHLSNGVELGPTTPSDLAAGEVLDIVLDAGAQPFDSWTPHEMQGRGLAVADGFLAGAGAVDGIQRQGDFDQFFGSGTGHGRFPVFRRELRDSYP